MPKLNEIGTRARFARRDTQAFRRRLFGKHPCLHPPSISPRSPSRRPTASPLLFLRRRPPTSLLWCRPRASGRRDTAPNLPLAPETSVALSPSPPGATRGRMVALTRLRRYSHATYACGGTFARPVGSLAFSAQRRSCCQCIAAGRCQRKSPPTACESSGISDHPASDKSYSGAIDKPSSPCGILCINFPSAPISSCVPFPTHTKAVW